MKKEKEEIPKSKKRTNDLAQKDLSEKAAAKEELLVKDVFSERKKEASQPLYLNRYE